MNALIDSNFEAQLHVRKKSEKKHPSKKVYFLPIFKKYTFCSAMIVISAYLFINFASVDTSHKINLIKDFFLGSLYFS